MSKFYGSVNSSFSRIIVVTSIYSQGGRTEVSHLGYITQTQPIVMVRMVDDDGNMFVYQTETSIFQRS